MASPIEIAYLAGLVDGEGSVTLAKGSRGEWRVPTVSVYSTTQDLVVWIHERFGGRFRYRRARNVRWRDSYEWRIEYHRALGLLKMILPHLVVPQKRQRAEFLVVGFAAVSRRNGKYDAAARKAREAFEREFFALAKPRGR